MVNNMENSNLYDPQFRMPLVSKVDQVMMAPEELIDKYIETGQSASFALLMNAENGKYGHNYAALAKALSQKGKPVIRQHMTNILNGTRYLPTDKFQQFFEATGNTLFLQYIARKIGLRVVTEADYRELQNSKRERIDELKAEIRQLEAMG